ncbi:MAG: inositol monophosphatase [Anaerolineales bacterium]|nr:inositol monophosphatase [Anaerolineales bacterium]
MPKLTDVIDIARAAGEILRDGFGKQHEIEYKGEIDLVTEIDKRSEDFIVAEIGRRFAGHTIFTEESGEHAGSAGHVWYVDPLDGTLNYSHGMPLFCVSIAYAQGGQLTLAAIYDPMAEELYTAEFGGGAQLNGQPIQVSQVAELKSSLLVTGFPYDAWTNPDNNFAEFERFSRRSQGVRRLGSAALDLAYVAAGRLDGFWEIRLNAWDVAAGALIVQEAGGLVSNVHGEPDFISKPQSILAANPTLHAEMLEVLKISER